MNVELDISGRVDDNKQSVLGMGGDITRSVWISAKEKRNAEHLLFEKRKKRKSIKLIRVRIFATLVFLLIKDDTTRLNSITIDLDYYGHDNNIRTDILTLCRKHNIPIHKYQIRFAMVGKKSPSHKEAYAVFTGKKKPTFRVTGLDILECWQKK